MNTSKWGLCCVVVAASISSGYAQQRAATWPGIPIGYESNALGALGGGKGSPSCHSESGDAACECPRCQRHAQDCFSSVWCGNTCLYAQAEVLFLDRDNDSRDQVVVVDLTQPPGNDTVLTTRDLNFEIEPSVRFLLGVDLGDCCHCSAVEFGYLGIYDWDATTGVVGNPDQFATAGVLGFLGNDFSLAEVFRLDYSAEIRSGEVNCVKTYCGECGKLDLLIGARYLELQEVFNINAIDFDEGSSDYNIRTRNEMYGGQIGVRLRRWHNYLAWEALGKAGLFSNEAEQRQTIDDFPNIQLRDTRTRDSNLAFVGEVGLSLIIRISDHWAARGGYNAIWIEQVALAPDQLDFSLTPDSGTIVHNDGSIFMHGASAGLEASW